MLSRPRLIVPLLALLAALLAGCGGGDGQSGGSQEEGGGQQGQQQESKKQAQETKIAVGNVVAVKPDRRRMVVQPSQEAEGTEKISINVRKTAEITLGGEKAEMGDIAEGQQAQAEYVVKNDVNRAVSVQLFEAGGSQEGQPQGEGTSN
jgi:predicted small secreted protein